VPSDAVFNEIASLRGELAARAGELDQFLRTAVSGANRWFVNMRDELYQRIDNFGETTIAGQAAAAAANGPSEDVITALKELREDVQELHTYLSTLDSNLQRFHDAFVNAAQATSRK
jgi:hypothetical protein